MQTKFKLSRLAMNTGQIPGLPKNPRQWTATDVDRLARSIQETPELLDARPLIVVEHGNKLVVLGGNLRLAALKKLGWDEAPCYLLPADAPVDKLKEIVIKDNGSFGSWDYDELANNLDDLPLNDWGVPAWDTEKMNLSTKGREGGEGYDEFVEKFKQKLTTDDCYTPQEVYDVVRDFVDKELQPLDGRKVIRPFYPGGDYENEKYPEGCVVLDNPPFSILSKILRFYSEKKIPFFLFGPQLTLFSAHEVRELTYLPVNAPVTYENGAVVSTGFITNMKPGCKVWIPEGLRHRIIEVQRDTTPIDEYKIPTCVITSSRIGVISGVEGGSLEIPEGECYYIKNLDDMADKGKGLYGGGI